ncbi:unnamed protein product [Closterium sp. NIES-53]
MQGRQDATGEGGRGGRDLGRLEIRRWECMPQRRGREGDQGGGAIGESGATGGDRGGSGDGSGSCGGGSGGGQGGAAQRGGYGGDQRQHH